MRKLHIDVENWPRPNYIEKYIPILIAFLALAVSGYSAYFTRESFVISQRPYVWATNYGYVNEQKKIQPVPQVIAFRVTNVPARIFRQEITIFYEQRKVFHSITSNTVQFPDTRSEWTFSIGNEEFAKILADADKQSQLIRSVIIHYSALDGGKMYRFELGQSYDPISNQWSDAKRVAS